MENFSRLFIIDGPVVSLFTESEIKKKFGVLISVDCNQLSIKTSFGRCPTECEVYSLMDLFVREYNKVHGQISVFVRKTRYRFLYRGSICGSKEIYLEYEDLENRGFPKRKKILHISMANKLNQGLKEVYVYDFLDYMTSFERKVMSIVDGAYNAPLPITEDGFEVKIILPRDLGKETGWNKPGEYGDIKSLHEEGVIVKGK